jgi:glycosyltransferase involved in cell wall biosynthesis
MRLYNVPPRLPQSNLDAFMNAHAERELQFGIDRLVTSGKRIFGWGWVAHPTRAITAITLLSRGDGWERRLPVNSGLARGDVHEAFPGLRNAGSAGFVVTGYIPGHPVRTLALEILFDGDARTTLDITHVLEVRRTRLRKLQQLLWLTRSVWRRLKRGDLHGLLNRAKAQDYFAPGLDDRDVAGQLLARLGVGGAVSIVFDHNMGGGANQYRRALIDERLTAGSAVLLCTYNLPTLDYRLTLMRPEGDEEVFRAASFLSVEEMLDSPRIEELFLNSPVSFDEPLHFAEWLATMRARHAKLRLTVAVHDYFAVCPSFVLLNADGRYCGIPDLAECAACMKRHQASYVSLSPPTEIPPWRAVWGRCLQAADEVRCFSNSTRQLLQRAYPGLDPERISVMPHRVDYRPARRPRLDHAAPLVVGIIGQISAQKGALVVRELVALLARDQPEARVVVIGTLDVALKSDRLRVTGAYRQEDLVDLIESNGVNMCFFPSICPETFSYVTEEMIRLDLPIVAFDLGAPGERLRDYGRARLCNEVGASAALALLVAFHEELAAKAIPVA